MDSNIAQIVITAITSGVLLYLLQYAFPSLSIKAESGRIEVETDVMSAKLVLDISEKYRRLAEDCAGRENELYEVIEEQRATLTRIERERDDLVNALRESNALVDELRSQLELHRRTTKTFPYVDLVANVYFEAEQRDYFEITNMINTFAERRSAVRDAIHKTKH